MDTYVCIAESLLCSSETVTTLLISYTQIKNSKIIFKNIVEDKKEVYVLLLASVHRHTLHSRVIQICLEWDWRSSSFLASSLFHFYNNPCWLQHSSLVRILGRNQELLLAQLGRWLTFPGWSIDLQVLWEGFSLPHLECFLHTSRRLQEQREVAGDSAKSF